METERLKYLFEQRFAGLLTAEEEQEFYAFTLDRANRPVVEQVIAGFLENPPELPLLSTQDISAILERIHQQQMVQPAPVRRLPFFRRWGWAAAAALLIIAAGVYFRQRPAPEQQVAVAPVKDIAPGTNKAILTLADGSTVTLDSAGNRVILQGTAAVRQQGGSLQYDAQGVGQAGYYNTLATPRGGQFRVVLSDGTAVWLNAGSSIRYPTAFTGRERNVEVSGEAYFEVASLAGQPFKVRTGKQEITVLGTHFNVKAYPDDPDITTTLLTGSVMVANTASGSASVLKPGYQARMPYNGGAIDITPVRAEDAISWKNGYFLFDNQDIKSIMRIISRWYNVDVEYSGALREERFGGTFSRTSYMREILTNLERIGNVHFELSPGKVTVTTPK